MTPRLKVLQPPVQMYCAGRRTKKEERRGKKQAPVQSVTKQHGHKHMPLAEPPTAGRYEYARSKAGCVSAH
eukprot:1190075-Rhodomonas_salina.1